MIYHYPWGETLDTRKIQISEDLKPLFNKWLKGKSDITACVHSQHSYIDAGSTYTHVHRFCVVCGFSFVSKRRVALLEFTTEDIREGRRKYARSTIQPYRQGELSREYIEAHGTAGISATEKEIKNAKNVWRDIPEYKNWEKTL